MFFKSHCHAYRVRFMTNIDRSILAIGICIGRSEPELAQPTIGLREALRLFVLMTPVR